MVNKMMVNYLVKYLIIFIIGVVIGYITSWNKNNSDNKNDEYEKLCPKCDGRKHHPVMMISSIKDIRYYHCPICGREWSNNEDE